MKLSFLIVLVFALAALGFAADVRTKATGGTGGTGPGFTGAGPLEPTARSKRLKRREVVAHSNPALHAHQIELPMLVEQ